MHKQDEHVGLSLGGLVAGPEFLRENNLIEEALVPSVSGRWTKVTFMSAFRGPHSSVKDTFSGLHPAWDNLKSSDFF